MKLLAKNQLVGTHGGFAVFRDLYEKENGDRLSVRTSREFDCQKERTLPNGKLTGYPSRREMFKRHKLK